MLRYSGRLRFRPGGGNSGATAIEYGIIAALVALGIFGGATLLGNAASSIFETIGVTITSAMANTSG